VASRAMQRITKRDLEKLAAIARADRERMFERNANWAPYRSRLLCVALCREAGQHYVDGKTGVEDFDLWTFFARSPGRPFPDMALFRRRATADFGPSRFGRTPGAPGKFEGRRVDLLSRSLDVGARANPAAAVRAWLEAGGSESARRLAEQAVVLIEPSPGKVIWKP
jgi:hypothetical protein